MIRYASVPDYLKGQFTFSELNLAVGQVLETIKAAGTGSVSSGELRAMFGGKGKPLTIALLHLKFVTAAQNGAETILSLVRDF